MNIAKIVRQNLSSLRDYVPGKPIEEVQREYGIKDVIKLASNENPNGASPKAVQAMMNEIQNQANFYPDGNCFALVQKLAKKHQVSDTQIFVESGLDGVITLLGSAFVEPQDEVIISLYSFPVYESMVTKMDAKSVMIDQTADFRIDIESIAKAITPQTKMICLCNPNNPTGTIYTREVFESLLAIVPEDVLIISDEAYYEFADDATYPQSMQYLEKYPNLIILRTFSKVYGLASVRVGYAIGHADLIGALLKVREAFAVNRMAQVGASAALDDDAFVQKTLEANRAGRQKYYEAFERLKIKYYPSQTNFIFFEVSGSGMEVYQAMLKQGVIIRPLASQGLPHHLRISIGTSAQNNRAIAALEKALI
ncbi:MAG: histidinol-phosphate transaminase [Anaerolineaceae bacterium]|nr:histidinol-phosphate transaminase [Anaerolineaceae bacterium]